MPIPDYQSLMLPLLDHIKDGKEHRISDIYDEISDICELSDKERAELLPSGKQTVIKNRIGWARTYMGKAGLLESPRRGVIRIADLGRQVLANPPPRIDRKFLSNYDSFNHFIGKSDDDEDYHNPRDSRLGDGETPDEHFEASYQRLRRELADELLTKIMEGSPAFFERLVVEVLVAMGYGGTLRDAGQAVGRSGDEGIDGVIKEDRLGLDVIYLQAKRWANPVGRPEIQKFVGALHGKQAKKGVFITTSTFTKDAEEYATIVDIRLVLIDGKRLAELMIDYSVGVATEASYEIKRIDADYFAEE